MTRLRHVSVRTALAVDRFPRIAPDEEQLIRAWLLRCLDLPFTLSIDVPIGLGAGFAEASGGVVDGWWTKVCRRRADLVVFHGRCATIVEVKAHAPIATATQVLRYCDEYRAEHPELDAVFPMVLCRTFTIGLEHILVANNGALLKLPTARAPIALFSSSLFQESAYV